MTEAFPPLALEARRLIDAHLDAIERVLAAAGRSRDERRQVAHDVESQILEMLAARAPGVAGSAGVAEVRAVLEEMDPPEAYGVDSEGAAAMVVAVDSAVVTPRISRTAVVGAVWAALFFASFVAFFWTMKADVGAPKPPPWLSLLQIVGIVVALIGLVAPIGTTACGLVAISQIRSANGRLCGMPLAVVDALFFPLLILDGVIAKGAAAIYEANHYGYSPGGQSNLSLVLTAVAVLVIVILDVVVVRAVWRAVRQGGGPSEMETP